jgi:hypothetical protein
VESNPGPLFHHICRDSPRGDNPFKIKIAKGKIHTDLFIKPTNLQLYLDFLSNHPEPCKEGIVYGQALRILERCSNPEDADRHLNDLKLKLKTRNYPEELIDQKFSQASKKKRKDLIFSNRNQPHKTDDKIRLIFTHNNGNPPLHKWMREAKRCLIKNGKAKSMGEKIQIGFRQPQNLKRVISKKKKHQEI